MFTYQLSEPRRPFASALQSTFIHASLIAGAVVATKAAPGVLPRRHETIYLPWHASPTTRVSVACECGTLIPKVAMTTPQLPELPKLAVPGGSVPLDPTRVIDEGHLQVPGAQIDSTPATGIFTEMTVDEPPTLLAAGLLRYPAILDAARVEGRVTLSFVIDAEGRVEPDGIQVISATDPGFIPAAREAVLTSRFHPAMKAHRPVRVRVQQVISFKH